MDIRVTTQYLQLTTRVWVHPLFQNISIEQAHMQELIIIYWHIFDSKFLLSYVQYQTSTLFVSIDHKIYSIQRILILTKSQSLC